MGARAESGLKPRHMNWCYWWKLIGSYLEQKSVLKHNHVISAASVALAMSFFMKTGKLQKNGKKLK